MENADFLEFSSKELAEIENLKKELKEGKLKFYFIHLLEKNDVLTVEKIINNQEKFYENLNVLDILKQSIENITQSIFRDSIKQAIENITKISEEKYFYIKELFVDSLIITVNNIEEDYLIEEGLTSPQIAGSPYHQEILKIAQKFLLENPMYVNKFEHLNLKEFKVIRKLIELDNKLPAKNTTEKKLKI